MLFGVKGAAGRGRKEGWGLECSTQRGMDWEESREGQRCGAKGWVKGEGKRKRESAEREVTTIRKRGIRDRGKVRDVGWEKERDRQGQTENIGGSAKRVRARKENVEG